MKSEKTVKAWGKAWLNWMVLTLFFIGIPSLVHADINDVLLKFYPYIRVQEEYDNNILLGTGATKLADYITTVDPGLRFFTLQPGSYGIDLDVSGGYIYYKNDSAFDYWNAAGRLNSWYALTQELTFRLRDYLIRSDAARESQYANLYNAEGDYIGNTQPDQYLISSVNGVHAVYLRNVVEPSMEYRFGGENLFSILYRNNTYRNENPQFEDSMENTLNPRLAYWFDTRNGVLLDYRLTYDTYKVDPDQLINSVTARYIYRFSPRTSVFGEYHYEYQDFASGGIDYSVHNPSLGIEYKFSPTLVGLVQGGYFWQIAQQGTKTDGPSFNLSLTQRTSTSQYTLSAQGGYAEDYISAQNLGLIKDYGVYGTINQWLTQRLSVRLTGSMYRYLYSSTNEKDWVWDAGGGPSYLLFRWLELSLRASYMGRHSNISGNSYTDLRGMFIITAFRPGYHPGMGGPGSQPGMGGQIYQ